MIQDDLLIVKIKKNQNLLILHFAILEKVIQTNVIITTRQERLRHFVRYSKKLQVWHRRFKHVKNSQIIKDSKILIGMSKFDIAYNIAKIYNSSKAFKPDNVITKLESNVIL